jgi:hypothetical protein
LMDMEVLQQPARLKITNVFKGPLRRVPPRRADLEAVRDPALGQAGAAHQQRFAIGDGAWRASSASSFCGFPSANATGSVARQPVHRGAPTGSRRGAGAQPAVGLGGEQVDQVRGARCRRVGANARRGGPPPVALAVRQSFVGLDHAS